MLDAIHEAEHSVGATLTASFKNNEAPVNPRGYFVPNFGVDEDIINVTQAINNT